MAIFRKGMARGGLATASVRVFFPFFVKKEIAALSRVHVAAPATG
jgi:hypothetical protein